MPLTAAQICDFDRNGFLPVENLLTPLEVKALHLRLEDIGNEANTSPNRRIGLTVAYMSAESKYVGKNPKPDYELVAGQSFDGCV